VFNSAARIPPLPPKRAPPIIVLYSKATKIAMLKQLPNYAVTIPARDNRISKRRTEMKIVYKHEEVKVGDSFTIPLTPNLDTTSEFDFSGPTCVWIRHSPTSWTVDDYASDEGASFGGEGEGDPDQLFDGVTEFHILDNSDLQSLEDIPKRQK
jgi:hypothetical protein